MGTGNERVSQILKAPLTGLTQGALTLGLGLVAPLFRHLRTVASWALDAVRAAYVPDGLKTFAVVDEGLNVYHRTNIAHETGQHKSPIQGERPSREGALSTPWTPN
jgi:hypothetical protein